MNVDKQKIIAAFPAIAPYFDHLMDAAKRYEINTPNRLAHWLGQMAHESVDFRKLYENLNYSAVRLSQVWPSRFAVKNDKGKTVPGVPNAIAKQIAHNPTLIANNVYANRMGNGSPATGDGWRYRGRGLKQLTGHYNYNVYSQFIFGDKTLIENPDLAVDPKITSMIAGAFWKQNGLNGLADKDDIYNITQRINGGQIGASDRKVKVAQFKKLITAAPSKPVVNELFCRKDDPAPIA